MISGDLFDTLNQLGKRLRNNPKPFGGIQLVLVGDFFQLPPVYLPMIDLLTPSAMTH